MVVSGDNLANLAESIFELLILLLQTMKLVRVASPIGPLGKLATLFTRLGEKSDGQLVARGWLALTQRQRKGDRQYDNGNILTSTHDSSSSR